MQIPASIEEAARRLRAGTLTCPQLVRACLDRLEALQPRLNAFLTVTAQAALAQAEVLERQLRAGADRGALHGIPIVYKDCLDTAGVRTTMGSQLFADRVPATDATVVERLAAAGAVMLGKTNMNEFAAGTSGKNAAYGDVRNPWSPDRSPGGSSSGTAVAVAAGIALAGVGTDTGGSIRIPAACTATVGIRPTFGRAPVRGCYPRSFSLDTVAPLARTVSDCVLLLQAMAGHDPADPHSLDAPPEDYVRDLATGIAGARIGVIRDFSFHGLDAEVEQALRGALEVLREAGAEIREVALPSAADASASAAFLDIMLYEFHQVLGERWRARADRDTLFGPVVRANLERGASIEEASYRAALATRVAATAALRAAFSGADVLVTPVLPMTVPSLESPPEVFDRERHFMSLFSLAGCPAISIPCGFGREGLPIGMQLAADRLHEKRLFRIAQAYESATAWHERLP